MAKWTVRIDDRTHSITATYSRFAGRMWLSVDGRVVANELRIMDMIDGSASVSVEVGEHVIEARVTRRPGRFGVEHLDFTLLLDGAPVPE